MPNQTSCTFLVDYEVNLSPNTPTVSIPDHPDAPWRLLQGAVVFTVEIRKPGTVDFPTLFPLPSVTYRKAASESFP
jgi:hypothetical protein